MFLKNPQPSSLYADHFFMRLFRPFPDLVRDSLARTMRPHLREGVVFEARSGGRVAVLQISTSRHATRLCSKDRVFIQRNPEDDSFDQLHYIGSGERGRGRSKAWWCQLTAPGIKEDPLYLKIRGDEANLITERSGTSLQKYVAHYAGPFTRVHPHRAADILEASAFYLHSNPYVVRFVSRSRHFMRGATLCLVGPLCQGRFRDLRLFFGHPGEMKEVRIDRKRSESLGTAQNGQKIFHFPIGELKILLSPTRRHHAKLSYGGSDGRRQFTESLLHFYPDTPTLEQLGLEELLNQAC